MLRVENVTKVFYPNTINENVIFNKLNFHVKAGDFVTIIGSNGAGKSTLLNLISGNLKCDCGKIYLDNKDITNISEFKIAKSIGRVFQNPSQGIAPKMTILENLALADNKGKKYNLSFAINKKRINYYKELLRSMNLGLEDKLNDKLYLLSGGQRQGVCILMAVMTNPKLLLLDEHTAALDPVASDKILEVTKKIVNKKKITTLMVTHNLNHVLNCGNRLIMMNRGKIVIDISGKEKYSIKSTNELLDLFEKNNLRDNLSDRSLLI